MTPVPYSSLWALGCDCASQELVWQYERETYGHGPFTWAETFDLNCVADLLCGMPETLDDTSAWIYTSHPQANGHGVIFDPKYKIGYVHHLPKGHKWDPAKSVHENFPDLAPNIRRRYERLAAELNDPEAHPVFCYWSHGYDPRKMTVPYTEDFNLQKANWFLSRMNARFPAKSGMLYLVNDKTLEVGQKPIHVCSDGRISAWKHGINRELRNYGQRVVLQRWVFGPCPELKQALVRVPNYDELFAKKVAISDHVLPTRHPAWADNLIIDRDIKRGYRMDSMTYGRYTILEYRPKEYLHVKWDYYAEEKFIYNADTGIWTLKSEP